MSLAIPKAIPKGQISTLSIFLLAGFLGFLGWSSGDNFKFLYMIAMLILIGFGIGAYAGWIPCKERLVKCEEILSKRGKK